MGVPQVYRKSDERAIASFDFVDIATGLGTVIFLGISSETSGAVDYHLITTSVHSATTSTNRTTIGTTTIDFDTANFNLPRTAKGTAYFSAGVGTSVATTEGIQLKVQLFHVDSGASETNITSEITTPVFFNASAIDSKMEFLELPITEKLIKKGEFLRLRVKMIGDANIDIEMGHDPKNRDGKQAKIIPGTKNSTVLTFLMPFRVDV